MKLLLVCLLFISQFISLVALENATEKHYCTHKISAFNSSEHQIKEFKKGKASQLLKTGDLK